MNIVKHEQPQGLQVWGKDFEVAQRMAQALASSTMFPAQFKDVGSCLIVLEFSQRLGMSPFEVAQNIDIIHGRPSWKSAYVIQCIASNYDEYEFVEGIEGKATLPSGEKIDNLTCKVRAKRDGKTFEGEPVSVAMAIADGWWGRKDSKWPRMTKQMLVYRAAAFFDRKWPTGKTMGIRPADEVEDIQDASGVVVETVKPKAAVQTPPPVAPPVTPPPSVPVTPPVQTPPPATAQVVMTTVEVVNVPASEEVEDKEW